MTLVDWLTITAMLLGPLLAVQVTQWLDRKREQRNRRVAVFQTLMATRATTLSFEHIRALNTVEVEFRSKSDGDRRVIEAWRTYLAHLSTKQYQGWEDKRQELLIELLHVLASVLNFPIDKSSLRTPNYYPVGHGEFENDQYLIRKAVLALLNGEIGLPVYAKNVEIAPEPHPTQAIPPVVESTRKALSKS